MPLKLTFNLAIVLFFAVNFAYSAPNLHNPNKHDKVSTKESEAFGADWEEAAHTWDGVRTVQSATERERRNAQSDALPATPTANRLTSDIDLSNLPIPPYVKELYRNLSQQDSKNREATAIRFLPAIHNGENNGE